MASTNHNAAGAPVVNETEARSGSREGVVRYVLAISLGAACLAMVVAYFVV